MDEHSKQARSCLYTVKLDTITEMVLPGPTTEGGANATEFQGAGFRTDEELRPGILVDGRYSILGIVGKGGMGVVYCAHHQGLRKDIALKTISSGELSPSAMRRFQDEARAIARLDQENVVKVFDFGRVENGRPYYTMELLSGESLAELIAREGRLEPTRAVKIFIDACRGLAAAHSKGLIHGDIKPANIFLHRERRPDEKAANKTTAKIVDFGIVSIVKAGVDEEQFQTGGIFGSPLYMSPEQFRGEKLGFGSDIYSCGCALYEALTGEPPFMGTNVFATMNLHLTATQATLSAKIGESGSTLPTRLEELVARMLAKEAEDRPRSFAEVERELLVIQKVLAGWSRNSPDIVPSVSLEAEPKTTKTNLLAQRKSFAVVAILLSSLAAVCIMLDRKARKHPVLTGIQANLRKPDDKSVSQIDSVKNEVPSKELKSVTNTGAAKIAVPAGSFDISSAQEVKSGRRTFKFPPGYSLGVFELKEKGYETSCPAEGLVHIPFKNTLILGADTGANPHLLKGFKPDSLFYVSVRNKTKFDDSHMEYLSRISSIEKLSLQGAQFSPDFINSLNRMASIHLLDYEACSQPASILLQYKLLKKVYFLDIARSEGVPQLLKDYPQANELRELNASYDHLSDLDLRCISRLTNLTKLKINGNSGITTRGILQLSSLPHLTTLEITDINIDPSLPDRMKSWKALKNLVLDTDNWSEQQVSRFNREWPR